MEISETRQGDVVILLPDGSLSSVPECNALDRRFSELLDARARRIVLDLCRLRRISSAALRTLLTVKRKLLPVGGVLVLCRLSDKVREVLAVAELDSVFTIVGSLDEAVTAALAPDSPPAGGEHLARLAGRLLGVLGGEVRLASPGQVAPPKVGKTLQALAERTAKALGCS
jgi:anti-anti-sigma factor